MSAEHATILIPDISGYTEFVSKTEIEHATHILNFLLETIVQSMSNDFVVSEIEGDAVLLYRKGNPPTKKEIIDQCVKTFTTFHTAIRGMDSIHICECSACKGVISLTLKFIVHFGTISENKVSRFVKASGLDMVIAHRLLKNNIDNHEYLLMTNNYLSSIPDGAETLELSWNSSREEYDSIGMVEFHFTPLAPFRKLLPEIPKKNHAIPYDGSLPSEIEIDANYEEVFATIISMDSREHYIPGLNDLEHFHPMAIIGYKFYYIFDEFKMEVEPMHSEEREREISYGEYHRVPEMNIYSVYHYMVTDLSNNRCKYTVNIYAEEGHELTDEMKRSLMQREEVAMKNLKAFTENGFEPVMSLKA